MRLSRQLPVPIGATEELATCMALGRRHLRPIGALCSSDFRFEPDLLLHACHSGTESPAFNRSAADRVDVGAYTERSSLRIFEEPCLCVEALDEYLLGRMDRDRTCDATMPPLILILNEGRI